MNNPFKGFLFGFLSGLSSSGQQIAAQALAFNGYLCSQLVFIGYSVSLVMNLIVVLITKKPIFPETKSDCFYIFLYCIFSSLSAMLTYNALVYAPIADVITITVGSIVVASVMLATIFLKEKINCLQAICLIFIILGLILCTRPSFILSIHSDDKIFSSRTLALFVVMIGGTLQGIGACFIRKVENTAPDTINIYHGISGTVFGGFGMILFKKVIIPKTYREIGLIIFMGFSNFFYRFFFIKGLQCSKVADVTVGAQVDIPFCYLFALLFLGEKPNALSFIGAIIVFVFILFYFLEEKIRKFMSCYLSQHDMPILDEKMPLKTSNNDR